MTNDDIEFMQRRLEEERQAIASRAVREERSRIAKWLRNRAKSRMNVGDASAANALVFAADDLESLRT